MWSAYDMFYVILHNFILRNKAHQILDLNLCKRRSLHPCNRNLWFISFATSSTPTFFLISLFLTAVHNAFAFQHLRWVGGLCVYACRRFTSGIHLLVLFFRWLCLNYQPPPPQTFRFLYSCDIFVSLSDVLKFCCLVNRCPAGLPRPGGGSVLIRKHAHTGRWEVEVFC